MTWDLPTRLPPSEEGEWWEMVDEESGLPYYYHTKTGETVWERPAQAFVIPLRVLQVRHRPLHCIYAPNHITGRTLHSAGGYP